MDDRVVLLVKRGCVMRPVRGIETDREPDGDIPG